MIEEIDRVLLKCDHHFPPIIKDFVCSKTPEPGEKTWINDRYSVNRDTGRVLDTWTRRGLQTYNGLLHEPFIVLEQTDGHGHHVVDCGLKVFRDREGNLLGADDSGRTFIKRFVRDLM